MAGTVPRLPNIVAAFPPTGLMEAEVVPSSKTSINIVSSNAGLPPFIAMPQSSAKITDRISNNPVLLQDSDNEVTKDEYSQVIIFI